MKVLAWIAAAALSASATALGGCDFVNKPTKTGRGQLYQSGDGRYDPWLSQVHQEQVAAASWPEESKAARKPIITALDLDPGASNSTILSVARESREKKKGDAAVARAVDETTAAERELARKLTARQDKLEALLERGEDLKKQAVEERRNLGADKADEAKVAKKDELKREVGAAIDAVDAMLTDAKRGAQEADELARKLRSAWSGKDDGGDPPEKEEKKKEDSGGKKREPAAKRPAARPAEPPAEEKPAAPKPPPSQKPPDEVFNP